MVAAAARRLHTGVVLVALTSLTGLGLSGCGNSLFDSNTSPSAELTQPKETQQQAPVAKIAVAPIIGAPEGVARQMQQEFTSAVQKQRVAVSATKDERVDYTLRGYIVAAKDKSGTKVSYIWDVTDPTGKRVNRITGEEVVAASPSKDPWAALTPIVAQSIADKAANSFLTWLPSQGPSAAVASNPIHPAGAGAATAGTAQPATQSIAATSPPATTAATGSINLAGLINAALVPAVTGAPGDGNTSLAAAMRRILAKEGVPAADNHKGAYSVRGKVSVGAANNGEQDIKIEWHVYDGHGSFVAAVTQNNKIPAGRLDGAWGSIADDAASGAAGKIKQVIADHQAGKPIQTSGTQKTG
jgi:hypothetical protein